MDQLRPRMSGLPANPGTVHPESGASAQRGMEQVVTSTWALRLLLPGLVAAAGLIILAISDRALRTGLDRLAQARFNDQSAVISAQLTQALDRAQSRLGALVATLANSGPEIGRAQLARELQLSMERNPAISWLSLSTPDGRFRGVGRDGDQLLFLESTPGSEERIPLAADGAFQAAATRASTYDPRQRPFWQAAVAARTRTWTAPYLFSEGVTGITCAQPWQAADGTLRGVLSLDFDARSLGAALRQTPTIPGSQVYVFASDGSVLGTTGDEGLASDRVVRLLDLRDPHLKTVVQTLLNGGSVSGLLHPEDGIRISAQTLTPAAGVTWHVVSYAPEAEILAAVGNLRLRSLIVAGLAILIAAGIGWQIAGVLVRVRRERSQAREAARQAMAAATDLGAYRLVKLLGKGGMGEVWRGEHRQLARPAAIKLMRPEVGEEIASMRERFSREAKVIAGLTCRNTVALYDYGISEDGSLYYVMELLDGLDLDHLVVRHGRVPPARAVAILRQACLSLAEAHDQGLVHRDIKPANIYLCRLADEVDVVKVLDFGLVLPVASKASTGRLSLPGMVFGTPSCMAPEQARGLDLDGRADLYALGCVAWWLLTGRDVYQVPDPLGQMLAHVNEPLPDLAALCPEAPADLIALVTSLLAKEPGDRPADAREVARRLRLLGPLAGEPWDADIATVWWQRHLPRQQTELTKAPANAPTAPTIPLAEL